VVKQLSKLLQVVTVPKARASIVWVIGEYHQHVPLLAPDVLRILAKSFTEEVHHRDCQRHAAPLVFQSN
jgi:AP-3 complex subunit beta